MKEFVIYDYKEFTVERDRFSFLRDGYANFGWEEDDKLAERTLKSSQKKLALCMRRNRKIVNKVELTRLERHFEACVKEIEELESSITASAAMWGTITAVLGTAFMACSVFAVTAQTPLIVPSIVLAIPGFLGWISPRFIYKNIVGKRTIKVTPLIEAKYDEIYGICEKGNKLLAA